MVMFPDGYQTNIEGDIHYYHHHYLYDYLKLILYNHICVYITI